MANQKAIRFEVKSNQDLSNILNNLIDKGNDIVEVIGTKTNGFGILTEGVIIYKKKGIFYF